LAWRKAVFTIKPLRTYEQRWSNERFVILNTPDSQRISAVLSMDQNRYI